MVGRRSSRNLDFLKKKGRVPTEKERRAVLRAYYKKWPDSNGPSLSSSDFPQPKKQKYEIVKMLNKLKK